MDAMITKQILTNYRIFSEQAINSPNSQKKADDPVENSTNQELPPKTKKRPSRYHKRVKRIQNKHRTSAAALLNLSTGSGDSRRSRRRKPNVKVKHGASGHKSAPIRSKTEEQPQEETFKFKTLPQVQAVITTIPKRQQAKKPPKKNKSKPVSLAKLDTKLKSLERSSLLSELTEEIMGGGGPLALIEPKVLDFVVTDPDKENATTILLTNNTAEMELFKIKTTNPYLFRVLPSTGYLYPKETLEVKVTLLEGVDVSGDRFLVMVAEIGKDNHVDRMTNSELVKLWRSRHINQWNYVYQEKISCRCSGAYRPKSRTLISAFQQKIPTHMEGVESVQSPPHNSQSRGVRKKSSVHKDAGTDVINKTPPTVFNLHREQDDGNDIARPVTRGRHNKAMENDTAQPITRNTHNKAKENSTAQPIMKDRPDKAKETDTAQPITRNRHDKAKDAVELCEVVSDPEHGGTTLRELSQSHTLSDVQSELVYADASSLALVPYQPVLNYNTNANIDEWMDNVPEKQKHMVKEIFEELVEIRHQIHKAKKLLDAMRTVMEEYEPRTRQLTSQQLTVKNEAHAVKSYVKSLAGKVKGQDKRITAEKLRSQFMEEVQNLNIGIDEVITQHEDIWRKLRHHDRIINDMKNRNNSNNKSNDNEVPGETRNRSHNAHLERHYVYDERREENSKMQDLDHNQAKLGQQLTEMAANISGLSRRAQTMNEVLKNVTSELKQQRKDAFSDVGKLEMKYLEQCALLPLQELGRQNQDMLSNMYTSFMAHIEKVSQTLNKLMTDHRALSHFINHQSLDFNKLKKGVCEMGKGIQAEHQHILNVSAANNKRFDKMELYQTLLENHMKDIHTALKNIMEKTKVIAQRTNNLEHDFAVTKRDMEEKINDMRKASVSAINDDSGNFDSLFEDMKDRLDDVLNEIRRLKETATQNESALRELAASLRQHKDQTAAQMTAVEQRTNAQIEHQLQEARRNFDNLKAKIAGFQGTLKGMDALLMTANEKLKSLYGDLERYKKSITEEMHRLAKDIAAAAERQMAEIGKTHGAMKKQIEGLLGQLSKAQLDAKAISARLTELENELAKKAGALMSEIKKAAREVQTAMAVRLQKIELFHAKTEEDLKNLADELQALREAAALLAGKMDDLENRTRQKFDDTKAALEDITARIERLTSVILDEFYNKMQRAAERLQEQLNQLENHMTHYVDSKIEELARKQANAARDQLAEIYLKMEHSDRLSEALRLQIDKIFYILIMLLILIPMFMYSAYMGRTMTSPMTQIHTWWRSCCGNFFLGKRGKGEL